MKTLTIKAAITGIVITTASMTANAGGYDPMATDRYSATQTSHPVAAAAPAVQQLETEGKGFRPFAANRYTATTVTLMKNELAGKASIGKVAGHGFKPFAVHRYVR